MTLSAGDRLGRFEVLAALGAGGMGEVYRARDPQLQRDVAIKVMPASVAGDPIRQRRFEQEARAAGGLNHPNIVAVHDVGVHDGSPFIVTELLEGETLRERLNGRPLSPRKAVDYGIQIASGLAAGHERDIVHRDIKPGNLFVTRDGRIKILDFGLAKLMTPGSSGDATATVTIDGIQVVPVVGTALYMSPEQARGLHTDHRSDIFSLGAVLYEMFAGFPPFGRPTMADTLSAILHDEPTELTTVVRIAPALGRVVHHCLEKKPEDRFQSVRDLLFDLEAVPPTTRSGPATVMRGLGWPSASVRGRRGFLLGAGALASLAYVAGRFTFQSEPSVSAFLSDYSVSRLTDFIGLAESPSISPDRKYVAFTASVGGRRQIFLRQRAGGTALQVTKDPADHQQPRWSPDSSLLVYFSPAEPDEEQGALRIIPALGGSPRRLLPSIGGADVNRSGRLALFRLMDRTIELVTASSDGTDVTVVRKLDASYHRFPRWSPDSQWIAYQRGDGVRDDIFIIAAKGGDPQQLTHDRTIISGLAWLPDGRGIIYGSSRGNTVPYLPSMRLWEVGLAGGQAPHPITPADVWYEQPDVDHETGLVSAVRMSMRFDISELPFDAVGANDVRGSGRRVIRQAGQTGHMLTPTDGPNGEIAFLSDSGGHANLWVTSTGDEALRQITFESDPAVAVGLPNWSPDGKTIAFVSSKGRTGLDFGIWLVNPREGKPVNIVKQGLGMAWSPKSEWLYYADTSAGALYKVASSGGAPVVVRQEATRNVIGLHEGTLYYLVERPLVDGRLDFEIRAALPEHGPSRLVRRIPASRVPAWQILNPSLSPDGKWLALPLTDGYTTNVWTISTGNGDLRRVTDFGDAPIFIARRVSWSRDGRSILAAIGEGESDIVLLDGLIHPP